MNSEIKIEQINSICVLCWGLIGDVLIRVALLEALKKRFPKARLTIVVDPASRVAVETHPDIDEVFIFSRNKKPLFGYIGNTISSIVQLRRQKFDLSVNLYSGGASPRISRLINARIRLGFNHSKELRKANNLQVDHPSLCGNWTLAFGTILAPLGITEIRRGTSYYCTKDAIEFADSWLAELPKKRVIVNLGAGAKEKIWPMEKYAELLQRIQLETAYHPILLSNPGQLYLLDEFQHAVESKLQYSVLPLTSFANVAAIIEQTGLIITGDTSIMHLAFGLKCPTLGIFTYTRPEIVDPEDCLHVACFEEGKVPDECGHYYGTNALSVETCFSRFQELINKLES